MAFIIGECLLKASGLAHLPDRYRCKSNTFQISPMTGVPFRACPPLAGAGAEAAIVARLETLAPRLRVGGSIQLWGQPSSRLAPPLAGGRGVLQRRRLSKRYSC
jgi:hypothetical protein